jgi:hypothetical protein
MVQYLIVEQIQVSVFVVVSDLFPEASPAIKISDDHFRKTTNHG